MADLALFDLFSPALSWIDNVMDITLAIAPVWRIACFAAVGGIASMALFKKLSNQAELAVLKQRIKAAQEEFGGSDLGPGELKGIIKLNLMLTGRQLWISFWPALVSSIPILFLLAFCSNQFNVAPADSDFRLYVTPKGLQNSPAQYEWIGVNAQWDARKKAWTFYNLKQGQTASLMLDDQLQLGLPTAVPTDIVHVKRWWNFLFSNPAGYLDTNASIESFEFNTPTQIIIDWGPGWMRGWLFSFMLFLLMFAVAIKIVWKIH